MPLFLPLSYVRNFPKPNFFFPEFGSGYKTERNREMDKKNLIKKFRFVFYFFCGGGARWKGDMFCTAQLTGPELWPK